MNMLSSSHPVYRLPFNGGLHVRGQGLGRIHGLLLLAQSTDGKWPSEEPEKYEREVQRSVHTMEPRTPFRLTLTAQDDPTEVCSTASTPMKLNFHLAQAICFNY